MILKHGAIYNWIHGSRNAAEVQKLQFSAEVTLLLQDQIIWFEAGRDESVLEGHVLTRKHLTLPDFLGGARRWSVRAMLSAKPHR